MGGASSMTAEALQEAHEAQQRVKRMTREGAMEEGKEEDEKEEEQGADEKERGTNDLPDEVLVGILRRVSLETGNQAFRVMEVCKQWERAGRSAIARLDLVDCRPRHIVKAALAYESLTQLTLERCHVEEQGWSLLAARCPHLLVLRLTEVSPLLEAPTVAVLLYGRNNLEHLQITRCLTAPDIPCLQYMTSLLTLNLDKSPHLLSLPPLHTLTRLTTLSLHHCPSLQHAPGLETLSNLRSLDLSGCILLHLQHPLLLCHLPSLERLILSSANVTPPFPAAPLFLYPLSTCSLPNLRHVSFTDSLDATSLPSFASHLPTPPPILSAAIKDLPLLTDISPIADLALTLRTLKIKDCNMLENYTPLQSLSHLEDLTISMSCIRELVLTASLTNLASLDLSDCPCLRLLSFPAAMPKLRKLSLRTCVGLSHIRFIKNLSALHSLDLGCSSFQNIKALGKLTDLRELSLGPMRSAARENLLPLHAFRSLRKLSLWDTSLLDVEPSAAAADSPLHLALPPTLEDLQLTLHKPLARATNPLPALHTLSLRLLQGPDCLRSLVTAALGPNPSTPPPLTKLEIHASLFLLTAAPIESLPHLRSLKLWDCPSLVTLPNFSLLPALEDFILGNCHSIVELPAFRALPRLNYVTVRSCDQLWSVSTFTSLPCLRWLEISTCPALRSVLSLEDLPALETLMIVACHNLRGLPSLGRMPSLHTLTLGLCVDLREIPDLSGCGALERIDARYCSSLTRMPPTGHLMWLRLVRLVEGVIVEDPAPYTDIAFYRRSETFMGEDYRWLFSALRA